MPIHQKRYLKCGTSFWPWFDPAPPFTSLHRASDQRQLFGVYGNTVSAYQCMCWQLFCLLDIFVPSVVLHLEWYLSYCWGSVAAESVRETCQDRWLCGLQERFRVTRKQLWKVLCYLQWKLLSFLHILHSCITLCKRCLPQTHRMLHTVTVTVETKQGLYLTQHSA